MIALLLPYCIIASTASVIAPSRGVRGAKIDNALHLRLRCFYSHFEPGHFTSANRDDALQFHSVVKSIFQQAAVIPFRFPTVVEGEAELKKFLREHSAAYGKALKRLRDAVQMEVVISHPYSQPKTAPSGKEYMYSRVQSWEQLDAVSRQARQAAGEMILQWSCTGRSRDVADSVRCHALIRRAQVEEFRAAMAQLPQNPSITLRVTGPWPPTEFLLTEA